MLKAKPRFSPDLTIHAQAILLYSAWKRQCTLARRAPDGIASVPMTELHDSNFPSSDLGGPERRHIYRIDAVMVGETQIMPWISFFIVPLLP
jgi:hypothetical protein